VRVYRDTFRPSDALAEPYVIAGVSVYAADDPHDAATQFATSRRRRVRGMIQRGPVSRDYSDDEVDAFLASPGGAQIAQMARYTAVGTPAEVAAYLENFAAEAHADELITVHGALDADDRERSLRLTAAAVAGN
jgi:putative transposase